MTRPPAPPATPSIIARGLTVEYQSGRERIRPIDGLDLEANRGELVLLLGPSGCGKTSLLSCLAGILTPTAGTVRFDGVALPASGRALMEHRQRRVGVVFQAFNLVPSLSAAENVAVPMLLAGWKRRGAHERARELLGRVNVDRVHASPRELSGGQQQRVAIARALALDPPVLLADEPTAHLDATQVEGVLIIVRELATAGRTVIVSTHDARLVPLADRVIDMAPAPAAEGRAARSITLRDGEILFERGDPGDLVFVVEQGAIELYANGTQPETLIKVVKPGEYFGELAPMLGFPRSASARARKKTVVTGLPIHEFRSRFHAGRRPSGDDGGRPCSDGHRDRNAAARTE